MINCINLFDKPGHDFYEEIRTESHVKHNEIKEFVNQRFEENKPFLDKDFKHKIKNEFESRLWELTVSDYLRTNENILLIPHNSYALKNSSAPDFCFEFNGKRFFVECVTVSAGSCVPLAIQLKNAIGIAHLSPRDEYQERFCFAIQSKIDKFKKSYNKIITSNDGFIIAVSSGKIGAHIHPLDILLDIRSLYGLSERNYDTHSGKISFTQSLEFPKKSNNSSSPIRTDYFTNNEHSYISAVLSSRKSAVSFSGSPLEILGIPSPNEEFILLHNPFASNKLQRCVLPVQQEYELGI